MATKLNTEFTEKDKNRVHGEGKNETGGELRHKRPRAKAHQDGCDYSRGAEAPRFHRFELRSERARGKR
jgi:hypothetical protein